MLGLKSTLSYRTQGFDLGGKEESVLEGVAWALKALRDSQERRPILAYELRRLKLAANLMIERVIVEK